MSHWRELPFAPQPGTRLCAIDEVPDGGGMEVAFGAGKEPFRVLLLRRGDQVWAYRNLCPHFSIPLNYEPDKFLTFDGEILMCAHHTAFFHFDDGYCFDGPCQGAHLERIEIDITDGGDIQVT